MEKVWQGQGLSLGVCYYPEQWDRSLWRQDYARMKAMGLTYVRMAEFAWSIFEPREGEFHFELFDEAIALAGEAGLKVILGTPTATPPTWLTDKYPEALNARMDGVVYGHDMRRHYTYNARIYQLLSARIVGKLADHYGDNPHVAGWQIDNELNCETNEFYADADRAAFRDWCRARYGTLEALNAAWGATFWNQTYTDWAQVDLSRPTAANSPNPHKSLDEKRFFSDSCIAFAKLQADILRARCPGQFVTHNGMFGHVDSHELTDACLDFFTYDSYPNFGRIAEDPAPGAFNDRMWSYNLSKMRSVSPAFAIMEQQSGPGGWINRIEQPSPMPGQLRLWAWQSIAHGADMVSFFRWRTASYGTEIYWHGIYDYDNRPTRRVREAEAFAAEVGRVGGAFAGSRYAASVAVAYDMDNEYDGEMDHWHGPVAWEGTRGVFAACQHGHIPMDVVRADRDGDLSAYQVIFYPGAALMDETRAARLRAYVEQGGTLVLSARCGYKDLQGHCPMAPMPGPLASLAGGTVAEFTRIAAGQPSPRVSLGGALLDSGSFNDVLAPEAAQVLGVYADSWYAGQPALMLNAVGQGKVYTYGGVWQEDTAAWLLGQIGVVSPASELVDLPESVELAIRQKPDGSRLVLLLNYAHEPVCYTLKAPARDLLSGPLTPGEQRLPAHGVCVLAEGGRG
ncbi:MAG: beta-galactosidase [Christensenellales bacterium]|jgi:beta-galactosidase